MDELERKMLNALINHGSALEGWKVKVLNLSNKGYSDMVRVELTVTKARCRKPFIWWAIPVNMARELAYFDKAEFQYM